MKSIDDPIALARQAAAEYQACYGGELVAAVVYGSAAGGDFDPNTSDINLLFVLKELTPETLTRSAALVKKWRKQRFARPLFLDEAYIGHSLDSFPIEFLNMKACHTLLLGQDPLTNLAIDDGDLRLQVERELKGKWLHLLQEWTDAHDSRKRLSELLQLSLRDFAAVFRALLQLKKLPVPRERQALFAAVTEAFRLPGDPIGRAAAALWDGELLDMQAAFPGYAGAVRSLIDNIDNSSINKEYP